MLIWLGNRFAHDGAEGEGKSDGPRLAKLGDDVWADKRVRRERLYAERSPLPWGPSPSPPPSDEERKLLAGPTAPASKKRKHEENDTSGSGNSDSSSTEEESRRHKKKHKRKASSSDKDKKHKKKKKTSKHKKKKTNKHRDEHLPSHSLDTGSPGEREHYRPPPSGTTESVMPSSIGITNQDEDDVVGPQPPKALAMTQRDFGGALLPGEGSAMAAFVEEGKRIPRRGEIGLTSDEIAHYEDEGFVMSGSRCGLVFDKFPLFFPHSISRLSLSDAAMLILRLHTRHRRMEAVRLRKENQIYSADERRAMVMFNQDQKQKRETKILGDFRELISQQRGSAG